MTDLEDQVLPDVVTCGEERGIKPPTESELAQLVQGGVHQLRYAALCRGVEGTGDVVTDMTFTAFLVTIYLFKRNIKNN